MMTAVLTCGLPMLVSCSDDDDNAPAKKEYFQLWNQCAALTALQEYVEDVTNPQSANYIPVEDRIATFDMDGTFVGELYPTYFEYNLLEYRTLDDVTYRDRAPEDVRLAAQQIRDFVRNGTPLPAHFDMIHARAAAKAYAGMTLAEFDDYVKAYAAMPANGFKGMTYGQSFYKPMLEVFDYLKDHGFTYYVVSGSDRFICRALVEPIGIAPNRVIGMDVMLVSTNQGEEAGVNHAMGREENLVRTDSLLIKNLKTNKVLQITQEIGNAPCCRSATAAATLPCTTTAWPTTIAAQPSCSLPTMRSETMPTARRPSNWLIPGATPATTSYPCATTSVPSMDMEWRK